MTHAPIHRIAPVALLALAVALAQDVQEIGQRLLALRCGTGNPLKAQSPANPLA